MSIVFSDNFNSGFLTGWGSPNTLGTINYWGVSGTYCEGCSNAFTQSRKTLASPIPTVGAIRGQVSTIISSDFDGPGSEGLLAYSIQDFHSGDNFNRFQLLIYFHRNGSFTTRQKGIFPLTHFDTTAAGLYPTDGTQFGLQIRFTVAQSTTVIFTVNNIDVATITYDRGAPFDANQWDDFWIYGTRYPSDNTFPLTSIVLTDNYEVDSSNASVSWSAGNAAQIDVNRTCTGLPPLVGPVNAMYKIVNGSLKSNDTFYNSLVTYSTSMVAIPQPLIATGFIGDEK